MYEIAADELKACHRLRARIPDAQIWMAWVGYRSVHRFGGRERREAMIRLHEKGYITDPRGKAKSVVFTEEGLARATRLVAQLFCK